VEVDELTEVLRLAEREEWTRLALVLSGKPGDRLRATYIERGGL
jgi:hypothetical protein